MSNIAWKREAVYEMNTTILACLEPLGSENKYTFNTSASPIAHWDFHWENEGGAGS